MSVHSVNYSSQGDGDAIRRPSRANDAAEHMLDWTRRPAACSCGGFSAAGSKTFTLEGFTKHLGDVVADLVSRWAAVDDVLIEAEMNTHAMDPGSARVWVADVRRAHRVTRPAPQP